ncbi:hypothetical protein STRNI_000286 [Streptomyces nigrescens]|uniref:Uncharacterized protein n=1 Tax=Streptomyces nigrescens TaxID=1920 RepID=A0ABY7IWG9_STRNI|nr:hypothetical protein STRNI_000286 [Streptomyces nigrescens]
MIRDGYGDPDSCHALYSALPRPECTEPECRPCRPATEDAYPPAPGVATLDIGPPGMLGFH